MEIRLLAKSDEAEDGAAAAAMDEIRRLNSILSGYDRSSEFSRWAATRNQAIEVSPDLLDVLKLWDTWRDKTGGALNPAAEAVSRIWKNAEDAGRLPTDEEIRMGAELARPPQWRLDEASRTATRLTDSPLILNSFTKSYIIEKAAAAALRTPGVTAAVVNIGGDLVVRGAAGDLVNIVDPRADAENSDPIAVLNVEDRAVATSGSYRRGFEIGGQHYSHIVDPRTGRTAEEIIGATVIAPRAVDAGALATAFCVLAPEESRKLAASVPGAEYMLIAKTGARYYSARWSGFSPQNLSMLPAAAQQNNAPAKAVSGVWNPGYELTVTLDLPQTQGFGGKRPYVAVWIEDKDRFPVRTLTVMFEKTRWLNELRAWYRDDRVRSLSEGTQILPSVTSATRSPGKYTFKWDGKDNTGKLVNQGRYTVLVEGAREHGGYNLVKREIDFSGATDARAGSARRRTRRDRFRLPQGGGALNGYDDRIGEDIVPVSPA